MLSRWKVTMTSCPKCHNCFCREFCRQTYNPGWSAPDSPTPTGPGKRRRNLEPEFQCLSSRQKLYEYFRTFCVPRKATFPGRFLARSECSWSGLFLRLESRNGVKKVTEDLSNVFGFDLFGSFSSHLKKTIVLPHVQPSPGSPPVKKQSTFLTDLWKTSFSLSA